MSVTGVKRAAVGEMGTRPTLDQPPELLEKIFNCLPVGEIHCNVALVDRKFAKIVEDKQMAFLFEKLKQDHDALYICRAGTNIPDWFWPQIPEKQFKEEKELINRRLLKHLNRLKPGEIVQFINWLAPKQRRHITVIPLSTFHQETEKFAELAKMLPNIKSIEDDSWDPPAYKEPFDFKLVPNLTSYKAPNTIMLRKHFKKLLRQPQLTELVIRRDEINRLDFAGLSPLPYVTHLELSWKRINLDLSNAEIIELLQRTFPGLTHLELRPPADSFLNETAVRTVLTGWPNLESLSLSQGHSEENHWPEGVVHRNLRSLTLYSNFIPNCQRLISLSCPNLTEYRLFRRYGSNQPFVNPRSVDEIFNHLTLLPQLETLALTEQVEFDNESLVFQPEFIKKLPKLKHIDVKGICPKAGCILPAQMPDWSQLEEIAFNARLSNPFLLHIVNTCPNLKSFSFGSQSEFIPMPLHPLRKLERMSFYLDGVLSFTPLWEHPLFDQKRVFREKYPLIY